ncbi:RagB/SusD family nutrient uptake outer membrane protein, partial [Bacteroides acidifaciens]
ALNTADKPIFKIEEVLLNYAEAMWEKGEFDQTVANQTINKLRKRAGVAEMQVDEIDGNFDTERGKYYPKGNTEGVKVDPVLWEIRRERIVELMGEGFGFYDVRRWRMAPWFINKTAKGLWMKKADLPADMKLLNEETGTADPSGTMTEGYVFLFNNPIVEGKGWLDKYYLYQIPTNEILLNPNLAPNNPGWD